MKIKLLRTVQQEKGVFRVHRTFVEVMHAERLLAALQCRHTHVLRVERVPQLVEAIEAFVWGADERNSNTKSRSVKTLEVKSALEDTSGSTRSLSLRESSCSYLNSRMAV